MKLQKDYEAGLIKESEMSQEQIDSLEKLYLSQIDELNEKFSNYKKRIIEKKNKIGKRYYK